MIKVDSIQKTYYSRTNFVNVLQDVSLEVQPGEILSLLGRNGSGKTTTIRIICGLVLPDKGKVSINGFTLGKPEYMAQLGALIDTNRGLYPRLSPFENLQYTCIVRGMSRSTAIERAKYLLDLLGLWEKRNAPTQTLSKGMLSKMAFALAIAHDPTFVLLDEPTLGLDIDAAETLEEQIQLMAASGKGILLTTHQMEVAERLSSRVAILVDGRIAVDKPKLELLSMFDQQRYRIVFSEPLLGLELPYVFTLDSTNTVLEVALNSSNEIYDLMNRLRPAPIKSIEKIDEDLGQIFKYLTIKEPKHA
ncbi:ABC transporter ATP-binding protein [Meiothermus sp.]|uniref:ABC transporter ATP-binding protein n=1 Tax=Meiothermus sp. TaxID=1955249 RepID=UPI00260E40A5|nr:ABC transporter ATP-binding protein [Meiothermus sp.]